MIPEAMAERIAEAVNAAVRTTMIEEVPKLMAGIIGAHAAEAPRPLVDINAVAQAFDVSVVTVRRMVKAGMPVEWAASSMKFNLDACHAWRREHGKRSVTGDGGRKRTDEPVPGVTLKPRRR